MIKHIRVHKLQRMGLENIEKTLKTAKNCLQMRVGHAKI